MHMYPEIISSAVLKILLYWAPFIRHPLSLSMLHQSFIKQREGNYQLQNETEFYIKCRVIQVYLLYEVTG